MDLKGAEYISVRMDMPWFAVEAAVSGPLSFVETKARCCAISPH